MEHTTFFAELLGIRPPWRVSKVRLEQGQRRVDIWVSHGPDIELPCPECQQYCGVYDHGQEREFRHLDVCQMRTYIHVRLPRVRCAQHGVRQVVSGLGEDNAGVTYEFESRVIQLAQECAVESVGRLAGLHWEGTWRIIDHAVQRGKLRKPRRLPRRMGVDEKAFAKRYKFETLIYDNDRGTVEHVCDNREQASLESYYRQFSSEELATIESVSMDMWEPFIQATKACVPDAQRKIVFDRYHVVRYVVEAVDKVRQQEHAALQQQGDERLKHTKYLWLANRENVPPWRKSQFEQLRNSDLKVGRAWALKESVRHLWLYVSEGWMRRFFNKWYSWAIRSRLTPMMKAARTLKRHLANILTYARLRVTNALGESLNAKIDKVQRLACGFRNREHYKTAIYFHCGGLDLLPRRTDHPLQIMTA